MFLLVIQSEDLTQQHKLRLSVILNIFSDYSFDHSLVLTSTPRADGETFAGLDQISVSETEILQVQELQTKMDPSVERNDGRHVIRHPSRAGAPVNFVLYGYVYRNIHIGCKFFLF